MSEYGLNNQRVDFTILNKNEEPVLFIEYDGEFHDKAERNKGELTVNKERDERKDSRAEELGIPIIRINYKEEAHITEPWLRKHIEEFLGDIW
jgi:very-short-patch-repair endonuclease